MLSRINFFLISFLMFGLSMGAHALGFGVSENHDIVSGLASIMPAMMGLTETFALTPASGALSNGSTGKIIWNIPQGYVIKGVWMKLGGTMTAAKWSSLRFRVGSKNILPDLKGADWAKVLAYKGFTADAAYLPIFLGTDYTMNNEEQARLGELDTTIKVAGQKDTYTEVTLTAIPDGTQDGTGTVEVWVEVDTRSKPDETTHGYDSSRLMRAFTYADAPITAANSNIALPFNNGTDVRNSIAALYLFNSNVTNFTLIRDQVRLIDNEGVDSIGFRQKQFKRVPQGGMLAIDFCPNGYAFDNALSLLRSDVEGGGQASFFWYAFASATETARQVVEILAPYAGI